MEYVRKLEGEKTYLSPLTPDHASFWYRWHNHLQAALLSACPGHKTPGREQEFRGGIESMLERGWHLFLIVLAESDQPIGWCGLGQIDPQARRAHMAVIIGERAWWSKGLGQDALRLLLDYGFNLLNLNSVELFVNEDNARAIRCYEKLGFQIVGRRREARIQGEMKQDVLLMDLLASEFESPVILPTIASGLAESASA